MYVGGQGERCYRTSVEVLSMAYVDRGREGRKEDVSVCVRGVMSMDEETKDRFEDIELSLMLGEECERPVVGGKVMVVFGLFLTVMALLEALMTYG